MTQIGGPICVISFCSAVTLEVKTQDLPESADFAKASKAQEEEEEVSDNDPMSDLSQNLLEDDDE